MNDHPYNLTRQDSAGTVSRMRARYLGDALLTVQTLIKQEVNPCLWRIHNEEAGRLVGRWRYQAGQVIQEV